MMHTPSLFALAFLVLILSCPVKKILQDDHAIPASPRAAHMIATSQQEEKVVAAASCCVEKKIAVLGESSRVEKSSIISDSKYSEFSGEGHEIFHYLSSVKQNSYTSTVFHSYSLPIYLRHSRLLI